MASSSQEATQSNNQSPIQCFKYSKRAILHSVVGRPDAGLGLAGERVVLGGWVKSFDMKTKRSEPMSPPRKSIVETTSLTCTEVLMSRVPLLRCIAKLIAGGGNAEKVGAGAAGTEMKAVEGTAFVRINDGSCVANLQIVVDSSICPLEQITVIGTSMLVEGKMEQVQTRGQYAIELRVEKILHLGAVDSEKYPLSKMRLTLEFVRGYPQFRARTTLVASITHLRSAMTYGVHTFFQNHGFLHVNMPIITTTMGDCSKKFHVTRLLSKSDESKMVSSKENHDGITSEVVRAAIREKTKQIEELKRTDSNKEALAAAEQDLQKVNELALQLEQQEKSISSKTEKPDFSKDFFGRPAYLSSYPGLHLETYACALGSVYTFGPVFQAEGSEHKKHLAERWSIEAELAFAELEDVMTCAEDCLKSLCSSILENCSDDLKFLSSRVDNMTPDRIQSAISGPLPRISYTEAVEILMKVTDKSFETKVEWGMQLSHEHQSYLADDFYKRSVIIYDYPKEIKSFYARLKEDGKTVSAFDIIVPKVGVVVSGTQKEERIDTINTRIQGLLHEQLEWYLDIRRHGTVKHSGFSINFEYLVMFVSGLNDVRDVMPFPRTKGDAKC